MTTNKVSLDEVMSKRQFSVKSTAQGDALTKIYKAPASFNAEARSADFIMTAQVKDRYGDIVVTKGGDIAQFEKNPVVLWAHNSRAFPIGMWSNLKKVSGTPKRLEGRANFAAPEVSQDADTAVNLVAGGMLRACSIGFMPVEWEAIDKENPWGGYQFLEWELLECSICSVPANPDALVKSAGGDSGLALQAIELVLDEWAQTPEGLIVPRQKYVEAYKIERNADVSFHEVRSVEEDASDDEEPAQTNLERALKHPRVIEWLKAGLGLKTASFTPEVETTTIEVIAANAAKETPFTDAEKITFSKFTPTATEVEVYGLIADVTYDVATTELGTAKFIYKGVGIAKILKADELKALQDKVVEIDTAAAIDADKRKLADEDEELELRARAMALEAVA